MGITPEEAEAYALGPVPVGHKIRSLAIDYGDELERGNDDVPGIAAGLADEFAVIFPESTLADAEQL